MPKINAPTAAAEGTAAEQRHPKEIAADWRKLRDDAAAQGMARDSAAASALLDEFVESVAASYVD